MADLSVLKTEHLYLNDSESYSCESVIAATYDVKHQDVSCIAIVTDSTVMHPQGGRSARASQLTVEHPRVRMVATLRSCVCVCACVQVGNRLTLES